MFDTFKLRYEVTLKILELQWTFGSCVTLCYSQNVRESFLTFLVTDITLKSYVRKFLTKTIRTG